MTDPPASTSDLTQTAATISGIAIALSALMEDDGPTWGNFHPLPATLLVVGLLALAGALFAVAELWWQNGLSRRDVLRLRLPATGRTDYYGDALLHMGQALYGLILVYVLLLFANAA